MGEGEGWEWGRVTKVRVMFAYVSEEFEALLVMVIGLSGLWHEVLSSNNSVSNKMRESQFSSLPGHYFFIDFDRLSCAMWSNFNGLWHSLLGFHWFYNCPIWPVRLQAPVIEQVKLDSFQRQSVLGWAFTKASHISSTVPRIFRSSAWRSLRDQRIAPLLT